MKLRNIILFFIFTSYTSSLYPQVGAGKIIKVVSTIHELDVTDSLFLKDIDSLLLNSNCPDLNDSANKYFDVYVTKSKENPEEYQFQFELFKIPIAEDTDIGYFEYNRYTFFVRENTPNIFFKRKNNTKKFTYKRGEYRITEEFPMWVFSYKNQRLILLENTCQ